MHLESKLCILLLHTIFSYSRSQWPRCLWRRSADAHLLRLWVHIPPGLGCSSIAIVVYCQVDVYATSWSLVQRSPTNCGVSLCVIQKPQAWGGLGSRWAAARQKKNFPVQCDSSEPSLRGTKYKRENGW